MSDEHGFLSVVEQHSLPQKRQDMRCPMCVAPSASEVALVFEDV